MGAELDVISAIEAAYGDADDDQAYLERLARAIHPAYGAGVAPTSAFFFDLRTPAGVELGAVASVGPQPLTREHFLQQQEGVPPEGLRSAFECDMLTLLSRVVGASEADRGLRKAGMSPQGARDSLGLRANATPETGVVVTTLVPWDFRIRQRPLWVRLAAHVGAGVRLRLARRAAAPEAAAAILSPNGKLEHANAGTEAARDELAQAAKQMDRARGKLRRLDPEEASSLWRAMVQSEWSLVDWFDHDGKRFLVAHENAVSQERTRKLSAREHQVVACAAMGHSNKLIAYDLGISTGTVAVLLSRAATKLGVSNRTALIGAFRSLGATETAR
jgi:DNA-binding NarL/FixJ family response regulator